MFGLDYATQELVLISTPLVTGAVVGVIAALLGRRRWSVTLWAALAGFLVLTALYMVAGLVDPELGVAALVAAYAMHSLGLAMLSMLAMISCAAVLAPLIVRDRLRG